MKSGNVIWITGLSGAGKSTVAVAVVRELQRRGDHALLLDADAVRAAIADPLIAHDPESRLTNAYRIARIARMLAHQGMTVVVPTMSLFHEVHAWNRQHLPGYFEVLLDAGHPVRMRRDPKGIYARAMAGMEPHVGGVDLAVDIPRAPHLVIVNEGESHEVPGVAQSIVTAFLERGPADMPTEASDDRQEQGEDGRA